MKGIKYILRIIFATALLLSCNDELEDNRKTYSGESFVRFYLLLNSNGQTYDKGIVVSNKNAVEEIELKSIKQLEIPVLFSTSQTLSDTLKVYFDVIEPELFSGYTILPQKVLTFFNDKFTDTIKLNITERWLPDANQTLSIKLTGSNNPAVRIGHLNDSIKNDKLDIHLGELITTINLSDSRKEIIGDFGEQIYFSVLFPNGVLKNEINTDSLFWFEPEFNFSLEALPFEDGDDKISFVLTLQEAINNDFLYYKSTLKLRDSELYIFTGISELEIIKPVRAERDNAVNTAANFYNLDDWLNRSYAELWLDYSSTGECKWRSSSMFTYPVVVNADHPNAVLYNDKGTADESDDIYHHAFRIGFNSPNAGRTTNSFCLKNWFNNEYTDADKSPGFNIPEALEFYPKDGVNDSVGTVLVIPQNIYISNKSDKQYKLAIKGEGTYKKIENDLFELEFYMDVTNEELFGGTQRGYYKLYNKNVYPEPEARTDGCFAPVDL